MPFLVIILFIIGLFMLFKPIIFWKIIEEWKSDSAEGPSNLYIISTRFGGVMCVLVGVGGIIYFFLQ